MVSSVRDFLRWAKHNLIPSPENNWTFFSRGQLLYLDYPIAPDSRYGHGKPPHPQLYDILNRRREQYAQLLASFAPYYDRLSEFIAKPSADNTAVPTFYSSYFSGYDALTLYSLVRQTRPRRYIEVGSGNSTYFVRTAIHDEQINTHITSIDPLPRRAIHQVADTVIESGVESVDLTIFDTLEASDIFFLDGSHRCFMNSDVTVAFLDIIPKLKPGVLIHVHDIWLPYDYPANWRDRYYSEQYLLACSLLAGTQQVEVILPAQFIIHDAELNAISRPFWDKPQFRDIPYGGGVSFWLKKL